MTPSTHLRLRVVLGLLAATSCAVGLMTASARTGPLPRGTVVVDEGFDSRAAARLFRTWGAGRWQVLDGVYVLRRPAARPPAVSPNRAISVLRAPVRSNAWRFETRVRSRGSEYSVLFGFRNPRHYAYVHVDRRTARSGVYLVRRGVATRIATLRTRVPVRRTHRVQLRRNGAELKVYLQRPGHDPTRAAKVSVPGRPYLRAGLGSWHSGVVFDDVRITTFPTTPAPGGRAVDVATSEQLTAALADARPGDVITMADGVYTSKGLAAPLEIGGKHYVGTFVASTSGTARAPIVLQGSRAAVIDGKPGGVGTGTQYGLYLAAASHWRVSGITVTNVSKGVVLDRSSHSVLGGLLVHTTGQEAIHLRSFSSHNIVRNNVVRKTGRKNETYGEGIYVGSATSNWGTYSDGLPDASDGNLVARNVISQTSAESLDIKEGTTGGVIRGNRFEGTGMTGSWADSWIDMKGNDWLIEANHGVNAVEDGFQVHQALAGWGLDNVFRGNTAEVNAGGYGFWVQNGATGNRISCASNTVTGAASGFANIACTKP